MVSDFFPPRKNTLNSTLLGKKKVETYHKSGGQKVKIDFWWLIFSSKKVTLQHFSSGYENNQLGISNHEIKTVSVNRPVVPLIKGYSRQN